MEEKRICAFIDILGFSEEIKSDDTERRNKIITLLKRISEEDTKLGLNTENYGLGLVSQPTSEVTSFSDNIVISIPLEDENFDMYWYNFLSKIIGVYWDGLQLGLLFRGGISIGRLYHKNRVVVGDSLVKSAQIEKDAFYPIIKVDDECMNYLKSLPMYQNKKDLDRDFLLKNINSKDTYIVNTLGYHQLVWMNYFYYNNLETIHNSEIVKIIDNIIKISQKNVDFFEKENEGIYEKWKWFLDNFLEEYNRGYWLDFRKSVDSN